MYFNQLDIVCIMQTPRVNSIEYLILQNLKSGTSGTFLGSSYHSNGYIECYLRFHQGLLQTKSFRKCNQPSAIFLLYRVLRSLPFRPFICFLNCFFHFFSSYSDWDLYFHCFLATTKERNWPLALAPAATPSIEPVARSKGQWIGSLLILGFMQFVQLPVLI